MKRDLHHRRRLRANLGFLCTRFLQHGITDTIQRRAGIVSLQPTYCVQQPSSRSTQAQSSVKAPQRGSSKYLSHVVLTARRNQSNYALNMLFCLAPQTRTFFDSADYQLAAMQARDDKDSNTKTTQQQASADWRALVKCSRQAAQASLPITYHANGTGPFHMANMATPGTQPLCRGVHRPSRLSQAGY